MRETGRHEKEIPGPEAIAPLSVCEVAMALDDDVSLVPAVRLLRVTATRRVQLDCQAPAFEDHHRTFAGLPGKALLDFRDRTETLSLRIDLPSSMT